MLNAFGSIDLQHFNRRAPDIGESLQERPVPLEVLFPQIGPRMEQPRQRGRVGIQTGNVRALVAVAVVAGQCQIAFVGRSVVLLGK